MVRKTTTNMPNVSSVSVIRVSLSVSAVRCIGMWFTVRIHGTGTYIPMECTLTRSRRSVIHSGGIGVMALTAGDGTTAGDGIVLTTLGDIIPDIGAAGMAATGVAGMAAVAIGDIITIGMVVLAGAGAVVETIGRIILITITVVLILEMAVEVLGVLLTPQVMNVELVQQLVRAVQMEKV